MNRLTGILVKAGLTLLVVVALLTSVCRLVFPYLNDFRQPIINQIERLTGYPIELEHIEGEWLAFGPSLKMANLTINHQQFDLHVDKITLELDVWRSLLHLQWQFKDLTFDQLQLAVHQNTFDSTTDNEQQKLELDGIIDIFLRQLNYFDLKNSQIAFFSPSGDRVSLTVPQLTWLNQRARHQAAGELSVSYLNHNQGMLKVIMDLSDDKAGLLNQGMIYVQADDVNMKPWLSQWVKENTGIDEANFTLTSWIRIDHRQVAEGFLKLDNGQLKWFTPQDKHQLLLDDQWFHLTKQGLGWQLFSPQLNIISDNQPWPKSEVSLYWQPKTQQVNEELRVRATSLQLEYLKPILPIFKFLDPQKLAPWLELDPQGFLSVLALDIPLNQPEQLKFRAQWQNVSWLPWQKLPGVNHFSGFAEGNLNQGSLNINLVDSTLPYQPVFRAPLQVKQATGQLYWQSQQGRWQLWSDGVDVQAHSLWLNGDFSFSNSEQQGPWLSILAGAHLDDAKQAWRYYPETLMGPGLVNYLSAAIQGGHAKDATLIFEGNPKQFPFAQHEGKFEVFAPLQQATLQFQPTWQPLTDLFINLDFVNNGLWMQAKDARLANISAPLINANIPAYQSHKLFLDADIVGSGAEVYQYLSHSPLRDSVAKALEQVQITGKVSGNLRLVIPLVADQLVDTSGTIVLDNNEILIKPLGLSLNKATGRFDFTNDRINGDKLTAQWLGQPVNIHFNTAKMVDNYHVNVGLAGQWAMNKLPDLPEKLTKDLTELIDWQSDIAITLPNKGVTQFEVTWRSRIKNVSKHLSALLGNQKGQPAQVNLTAKGNVNQFNLSGFLGANAMNSAWLLSPNVININRASWHANSKSIPPLPKESKFAINLAEVNGDYWLPLLATQTSNSKSNSANKTRWQWPKQTIINTPAITFAGQRWRQVNMVLESNSSGSELVLASKELTASLVAINNQPWLLNIKHLYYNPLWPSSVDSQKQQQASPSIGGNQAKAHPGRDMPLITFRHWPDLHIRCNDCWFMGQSVGKLEANLHPSGTKLRLTHGMIDTGNTKLSLTGEWLSSATQVSSHFKGNLVGDKFNQSMRHFGIETPIRDARYTFDFDLAWQGEPWRPHIETLSGNVSAQFGKGHVANLGGGTANQIMRFVSVTALLKKLQSDFSDTFDSSFDFDMVRVNSNIVNGLLTTEDLLIDGTSADIAMLGSVDLVRQTVNMEAVVAPELSAAVGVTAAFVINPVAGVAVFAASKVLSPLWNKISFIRYNITGSLDNPQVSEVLRLTNKEK